jgi:hypothetical protein
LIDRCHALGAKKITLLVRAAAMTDLDLSTVDVVTDRAISRLFGSQDRLSAVALTDLTGAETRTVEVDHLIFSAGRIPELIFVPAQDGAWEAFPPYKQPAYHHETGLMAKGDSLTDFQAAIKAIAAGRRAAVSLHKALYGLPLDLAQNVVASDAQVQNVDHVVHVPVKLRQIMPLAPMSETVRGQELEKGFTAEQAKTEADRCLRCGLICYLKQPQILDQAAQTAVAG